MARSAGFVCPGCGGHKSFQGKLCRVCRFGTLQQRLEKYILVCSPDECWPWIGHLNGTSERYGNYGRLQLPNGLRMMAHRFVYELNHGPIPDGFVVCHRCDNPPCCNPSHLFLGTSSDNSKDAYDKGRIRVDGEHNPFSKLTTKDVRQILRSNHSLVELAKQYNVHPTTIGKIKSRRAWKHVSI